MSPQVAPLDKPALWPVDMPLVPRPGGPLWMGVAGKGGAGKSVLSAKGRLLDLDADGGGPGSGLFVGEASFQ